MPSTLPASTDEWWCPMDIEYGFVGFSYEVTACQSLSELERDFENIRLKFKGRYIRMYGFCDNDGFYDNIIEAAWTAGIGVHALIWFGFDGSDQWMTRRDNLFATLHSNPKAPFVTRAVQFGSEPLYDSVLSPQDLADQVWNARYQLSDLRIPVTVSDLAYSYQVRRPSVSQKGTALKACSSLKKYGGAPEVLEAINFVDAHMLPFFSQQASIGKHCNDLFRQDLNHVLLANESWPLVLNDLNWFVNNAYGKKIYLSENGWPSTTYPGVQPNSPYAVADVQNEQNYFDLLDSQCTFFKTVLGGGVGWFAHIYSDNMEPGYGIYATNGQLKFPFAPKTSC
ncbi:glycoside hydrolase superfamily [Lentinula raphanica]|uniref:glucan endo-1,3-beta-D-glucosidase n=1 Tax=Lentinula raphanica TaxID=153919 RepID=A0AA38PF80_9AGAR|nr:glycoside hydrolase superfamily [Lentinula raphanica]KAJ3972089.1 glycoside hydrolase superfamily [Lentinula raphanica]